MNAHKHVLGVTKLVYGSNTLNQTIRRFSALHPQLDSLPFTMEGSLQSFQIEQLLLDLENPTSTIVFLEKDDFRKFTEAWMLSLILKMKCILILHDKGRLELFHHSIFKTHDFDTAVIYYGEATLHLDNEVLDQPEDFKPQEFSKISFRKDYHVVRQLRLKLVRA